MSVAAATPEGKLLVSGLWSPSVRPSFHRGGRRGSGVLSAEADRQTVPLPASPGVAVILRVCVSAVGQNGVVDQRWVVETLHVELGSGLGTTQTTQRLRMKTEPST